MRIAIDTSAANDPESHRQLDRILYKIEEGWHVWDTTDHSVPDALETTAWIRDRGPQGDWVQTLLVASICSSAWHAPPHGRSVRVTAQPSTADALTPEAALRLAEQPLVILVENRVSDGAFVERVMKELDEALRALWRCPGLPIHIDSVGGIGQMRREVERRINAVTYRPRLVVVADSGRRAPDTAPNTDAKKLATKCASLNTSCWILAKREAENYLPEVLLRARPDAGDDDDRRVDAWTRLSDDQKDFLDMKDGLSESETELFRGLSSADRATLSTGFGGNVYKCWNIDSVDARTDLAMRGRSDLEHGLHLIRGEV